MTDPIEVPEGLDADAAAEFIRSVIRDRGGDPDTAYLVSVGDRAPETFKIDWRY